MEGAHALWRTGFFRFSLIDQLGLLRTAGERVGINAFAFVDAEGTSGDHGERVEAGGNAVFTVDGSGRQLQRGGIVAALQHATVVHVGDDLVALVTDTPCLKEVLQIRDGVDRAAGLTSHGVLLAAEGLRDDAVGINKGDDLATTEQELVDGIFGALADVGGMQDEEHLDVGVDFIGAQRDFDDFIVGTKLLNDHPWPLTLLLLERIHR